MKQHNNMQIADRIRQARHQKSLTQAEVARALAVHRGTYGHWERGGGHIPSSSNLAQLAAHLEVSYEWLATGRGSMYKLDGQVDTALLRTFAADDNEEQLLLAFRRMTLRQRRQLLNHLELKS